MSVPKHKRSEGKLIVQTKAYEFASYTHQICSNEKVFLKRNRWCGTSKIVDTVDEIVVNIDIANEIDIRDTSNLPERRRYQDLAITMTIRLETLMEIAYRDNNRERKNLPDDKFNFWIDSLLELRMLIRKWRNSIRKGNY